MNHEQIAEVIRDLELDPSLCAAEQRDRIAWEFANALDCMAHEHSAYDSRTFVALATDSPEGDDND